jgi:hypothetical protein
MTRLGIRQMLTQEIVYQMRVRAVPFEPQNVEQGISGSEMHGCAGFASAVRNSLLDIRNFKYL